MPTEPITRRPLAVIDPVVAKAQRIAKVLREDAEAKVRSYGWWQANGGTKVRDPVADAQAELAELVLALVSHRGAP